MDLLLKIEDLKKEYREIEITNVDATGQVRERAAYFFDRHFPRHGKVFLELWQNERDDKLIFILFRSLATPDENEEMDGNRRPTANRGNLYRFGMTQGEMLKYIRKKLDLYYKQHNYNK